MSGNPLKGSRGDRAVDIEPGLQDVRPRSSREEAAADTHVEPRVTGQPETGLPSAQSDIHAFIGRQLRAVYDDVAKQPVPDRFLELMKQLEVKTAGR